MPVKKSLVKETVTLLRNRGAKSLEIARQSIRQEEIKHKLLAEAMRYFATEAFPDVMHPGLLTIYCEAVGGKPDETIQVGAAMTLLVAAADIHDDLVDGSEIKNGKPTVLGKYGKDIAVLTGDAFLIKGLYLLYEAIAEFPSGKKNALLRLVKQAFFDLSSAEAEEAAFRGNVDISGRDYFELIKRKIAVAEATAKIGAILGNGTINQVRALGEIGYTLGLLNTLRDEFIDVFEADELSNRFKNEILPLPVLYVFQDPEKKKQIIQLLKELKLTKAKTERIVDIVMEAKETEELRNEMRFLMRKGLRSASKLRCAQKQLMLMLNSATEDLSFEP